LIQQIRAGRAHGDEMAEVPEKLSRGTDAQRTASRMIGDASEGGEKYVSCQNRTTESAAAGRS
jgi:hypothetical protein